MKTITMKSRLLLCMICGLTLLLGGVQNGAIVFVPVTQAAEEATPPNWMYHKKDIVDEAFVKPYAAIPKRDDVMIIDSRPTARKYDGGHIPTSISIPDRDFNNMTDLLPNDKNTLLIFYCGGTHCKKSHKSAYLAEELGYKNIKVYSEGYPDWIKKGNLAAVSTAYVKKTIDKKDNVIIVDTRPQKRKYDKGHIPTAINIPDRQFDKMVDKLPTDKNTPLIFYCGGFKCTKSVTTANKAIGLGYKNIKIYPAGYPAWKKAYGVDQTAETARQIFQQGPEEGSISIASFQKIMKENPDNIILIDTRDPDQHATGSIKGSVNIPIDDLDNKIDELPKDKPIVFFCNSGGLAGESYDMVKEFRPNLQVYFLSAQMTCKKDGTYKIEPLE